MTGILLLFLLSFLLLGPKRTSDLTRQIGKQVADLRRAANNLQAQIKTEIPPLPLAPSTDKNVQQIVFDLVTSGAFIPETEQNVADAPKSAPLVATAADFKAAPEVIGPAAAPCNGIENQ